jgi:putative ABC transport system permease protein
MTTRTPDVTPPRLAEAVLASCLPRGLLRDSLLGDLQQEFARRAGRTSRTSAALWYWRQALLIGSRYVRERVICRLRPSRTTRAPTVSRYPDPQNRFRNRLMIDSLIQDVRYALRTLRREPGWTAGAVGTLTLAIGASTAIFSVVNPVLFRRLEYDDPARLVALRFSPADEATRDWVAEQTIEQQEYDATHVTFQNYEVWRQATEDVFVDVAAYSHFPWKQVVNLGEVALTMRVAEVTASLGPLLGVSPLLGRWFLPEEDVPGSPGAVVLSHGVWQRYFGGSADVLGKTIFFREQPHTVVGVMPRWFDFPSPTVQLWFPMAKATRGLGAVNYEIVGRLRSDATIDQASAKLRGRSTTYPFFGIDRTFSVGFESLHRRIVGNVRPLLLIFLGTVTAFLLIGCVNVVNLMLTRSTSRAKEHTVRAALGAGRGRLAQQLLTESIMVSLLGAGLGLLLAKLLTDTFLALSPILIPRQAFVGIDASALGFTLGLAIVVGVCIGVVPAFRVSRTDLARGLHEGARSVGGTRHARTRDGLVIVQLALALVLLVCSGLLLRSFRGLLQIETGFDPQDVVTFEISLPESRYRVFEDAKPFHDELLEGMQRWPDLQSAGLVTYLPVGIWSYSRAFGVDGYQPARDEELLAELKEVTPGYFQALGVPLVEGRRFDERDDWSRSKVVIVNRSMARRYWPGRSAVGGRLRFRQRWPRTELWDEWAEVVGVVDDVQFRGVDLVAPQVYQPYAGSGRRGGMAGMMRVTGPRADYPERLRRLVASIDPEVAVSEIAPLETRLENSVSEPRFRTAVLGAFGVAALLLSVVGVYGVMSYAVARRTRELGIRKALGADRVRIMREVVFRALKVTAVGLGLGTVGAYAAVDTLQSYLFRLDAHDPLSFVIGIVGLTMASMVACYVPARRAATVDPLIALRAE